MKIQAPNYLLPSASKQWQRLSLMGIGLMAVMMVSSCQVIPKNLLGSKPDKEKATIGERQSINAFEASLVPSKTLEGVGYYIPDPEIMPSWEQVTAPKVEHLSAGSEFKIAWKRSVGKGAESGLMLTAQPVSDGVTIFTMDAQAKVTATSVDGKARWSKDLNPKIKRDKKAFGGGLALRGQVLYVSSGYRFLSALDATTGSVLWTRPVDSPLRSAPIANDQIVVITDVDNQIFAFNATDGSLKWTYQAIAEPARILRSASPLFAGNRVVAPFSSGEMIALDSATGQEAWLQTLSQSRRSYALSEIRDISGNPVLHNGQILAASHSGLFSSLDAQTGAPTWQLRADSVNSPWIAGDVIYLLTLQSELIAVSKISGQIYWVSDIDALSSDKARKQVKEGKEVTVTSLSPKQKRKMPQWTGPILASNRLLVVSSQGDLVAFDPVTGAYQSSLNLGSGSQISPIAVNDKIFVVTKDSKLVAIK
jgi:outer membrane protein assembly factor BamB